MEAVKPFDRPKGPPTKGAHVMSDKDKGQPEAEDTEGNRLHRDQDVKHKVEDDDTKGNVRHK